MAEEIDILEEELAENGSSLLGGLRRVLMAGIGAAALAQEEIEEFVGKLIDRGEIAEKDGRKLIDDIKDRRRKRAKEAEEALEQRIENLLDRMNIPTKNDIQALNTRVSDLISKVDELKSKQK